MKKAEFIKEIANRCGATQKAVNEVIEATGEVILDVIANNDSVKFANVCTFKGVSKDARIARNPRTGESVNVPARDGYPKCSFTKTAKE